LLDILKKIYVGIISANSIRLEPLPLCYEQLLDQALARYSRDVFGEARLRAKLDNLKGHVSASELNGLENFSDYGIKIDSCSPYVHRQAAVLLYWLSVLKPFSIKADSETIQDLGIAYDFHNEYVSYYLVLAMLKTLNWTIAIHENPDYFHDFLYDLHYRNLSRSSLEFFLHAYIKPIHKRQP
jgi:hypothetical protein